MMAMNKPKITKAQAKAIEGLRGTGVDDERIVSVVADPNNSWLRGYESVNDLEVMTLAAALINGYDVEETKEEELASKYRSIRVNAKFLDYNDGKADGIKLALNILGIKIEGVNA